MKPALKYFNSHQGEEDKNDNSEEEEVVERKDGPCKRVQNTMNSWKNKQGISYNIKVNS